MMSWRAVVTKLSNAIYVSAITLSFGYISLNFIAEPILCSGPSMEPTLRDKDIILIERYSSVFVKKYNRGDVVVARCPSSPNTLICKRVVAIAGDTVRQKFFSSQVIPRGHVWLLGDNTDKSTDSRQFGPIPVGLIQGKAIYKLWPLKDRQLLSDDFKKNN